MGSTTSQVVQPTQNAGLGASTHEELKRLAAELHTTVGNTVSIAVRALRQDRVAADLAAPLRDDEAAWLDADLG
ncbi:MAG TPA: hypothetical protein VM143_07030 [Acidimicrobiales bacterium]|nr:hypothetical protein [Acidimicrobiales bacterium]